MSTETVLITGCSSGIGRATATAFLEEGWTVYATARDIDDVEPLGEAGAELAALDVTDDDAVERVVDRVVDEQGAVDCLVNNAGFGQLGPVEDVPVDAVEHQFDVNVYGPHRLVRAVLPHMRAGDGGTVVNVSSVAGRISYPGSGVYCGTKFALEAMTDALRVEVAPFDVDAVLVEPGPVDTGFTARAEAEAGGNGDGETDIDRSGAYEWFYDLLADTAAVGGGGPVAVTPERVAEDVVDAASSTKPPARIPIGLVGRVGVLSRFLPTTVRDAVFSFVRRLAD
ncbi:MAG: SDR family oxidoreductase [Halolamina sp.]